MLHVDNPTEPTPYVLLVGPNGEPINGRVLPFVASDVEVKGELTRVGNLYALRIDTGSIQFRN